MRVQVITPGSPPAAHPSGPMIGAPGVWPTPSPWRPAVVLGAASPGALRLPDAHPTASAMYAPRAVWIDDERVIVADTGNHRVLIWSTLPTDDGAPADVVLGQPDDTSEGQANGGPALGLNLPTGVIVTQGRLVVADAWHHRLLIWDTIPTTTGTPPDRVLGQVDLESVEPNGGGDASATTMYWPFGIAVIDDWFYVADTGNRRVLGWRGGVPDSQRPADLILGQPDEHAREENRGGAVAPDSFRWPHAFAATPQGGLLVADAGNHRILSWHERPERDTPADAAIGQPDLTNGTEFPYISQRGRLRFPYGLTTDTDRTGLAIADTANNRILVWDAIADAEANDPDHVLGQRSLDSAGENRWESVEADTLCWPYGLHWSGRRIAVADSGNNRVVIWEKSS